MRSPTRGTDCRVSFDSITAGISRVNLANALISRARQGSSSALFRKPASALQRNYASTITAARLEARLMSMIHVAWMIVFFSDFGMRG